jgi:hypothetical protein
MTQVLPKTSHWSQVIQELRGPVRRFVHGTSASEEALGRKFHNIRRLVIIRRVSGKNSAHGVVGFDEDAGKTVCLRVTHTPKFRNLSLR